MLAEQDFGYRLLRNYVASVAHVAPRHAARLIFRWCQARADNIEGLLNMMRDRAQPAVVRVGAACALWLASDRLRRMETPPSQAGSLPDYDRLIDEILQTIVETRNPALMITAVELIGGATDRHARLMQAQLANRLIEQCVGKLHDPAYFQVAIRIGAYASSEQVLNTLYEKLRSVVNHEALTHIVHAWPPIPATQDIRAQILSNANGIKLLTYGAQWHDLFKEDAQIAHAAFQRLPDALKPLALEYWSLDPQLKEALLRGLPRHVQARCAAHIYPELAATCTELAKTWAREQDEQSLRTFFASLRELPSSEIIVAIADAMASATSRQTPLERDLRRLADFKLALNSPQPYFNTSGAAFQLMGQIRDHALRDVAWQAWIKNATKTTPVDVLQRHVASLGASMHPEIFARLARQEQRRNTRTWLRWMGCLVAALGQDARSVRTVMNDYRQIIRQDAERRVMTQGKHLNAVAFQSLEQYIFQSQAWHLIRHIQLSREQAKRLLPHMPFSTAFVGAALGWLPRSAFISHYKRHPKYWWAQYLIAPERIVLPSLKMKENLAKASIAVPMALFAEVTVPAFALYYGARLLVSLVRTVAHGAEQAATGYREGRILSAQWSIQNALSRAYQPEEPEIIAPATVIDGDYFPAPEVRRPGLMPPAASVYDEYGATIAPSS